MVQGAVRSGEGEDLHDKLGVQCKLRGTLTLLTHLVCLHSFALHANEFLVTGVIQAYPLNKHRNSITGPIRTITSALDNEYLAH